MLKRAPIRLRLTLWYVLLMAVILAAFCTGVYLVLREALYQNLDDSVENRASVLLNAIQYDGDRPFLPDQVSSGQPAEAEHLPVCSTLQGN